MKTNIWFLKGESNNVSLLWLQATEMEAGRLSKRKLYRNDLGPQ